MGLEWCMGMPPLFNSYTLFSLLSYVSHHALLSLVMLPSPQLVSSVWQGLCWLCMHRPHEDVVGLEWCMGMPPLVHFLYFISLLGYVSPPCASLPCHVSFVAGSEYGWRTWSVFCSAPAPANHACIIKVSCTRRVGFMVMMTIPPFEVLAPFCMMLLDTHPSFTACLPIDVSARTAPFFCHAAARIRSSH